MSTQPLRVGIGGPVGSGKTALTLSLCRAMREDYEVAVVTNDIYTREDAEFCSEAIAVFLRTRPPAEKQKQDSCNPAQSEKDPIVKHQT